MKANISEERGLTAHNQILIDIRDEHVVKYEVWEGSQLNTRLMSRTKRSTEMRLGVTSTELAP
jgi:hypothetical protein